MTTTSTSRRRVAALLSVTATCALTGSLVACGADEPTRSTEAFCSTMKSEQARIRSQFDETMAAGEGTNDEFLSAMIGVGATIQALGEMRTYFDKLAKVAPPEIQTEAEIVAQSYRDQLKSASEAVKDPLGAIASGLISSIAVSGQTNALNEFAQRECGQSL